MAHLALLGGSLRSADPRRFLVEAMVCAMNADGVVDPRELAVLRRHLAGHELFLAVPATVADLMVSMATDALGCVGDAHARVPAIARGLPSRIHRLTAYAMACEVVQSDADVAAAEKAFLEVLRQHLRVSAAEGVAIMTAIAERRLGDHLAERIASIRGLAPAAAELFAVRAHLRGCADDGHRGTVRELFLALPDLTGSVDDIDGQLVAAFRKPRADHIHDDLRELAATLPDPVDRWWLAAYVLAAEPASGKAWRGGLFGCLLQSEFGLGEVDMDLAASDADALLRVTGTSRASARDTGATRSAADGFASPRGAR